MSISFSVVFYHTSDMQFSRPFMPGNPQLSIDDPGATDRRFNRELRDAISDRFDQTRQELAIRLVWINVSIFLLGIIISYYLARWSLRPIEQSMEAQTQFVTDVSHELRTPLAVMQTTNEVALRKPKLTQAEIRELTSHNINEVKRLHDLTNTLLDLLSQTDRNPDIARVDLQNVISEAMSFVVKPAQDKNISIDDLVAAVSLRSNHDILVRVLAILLDNAIKYSPDNSKVTVTSCQKGKKVFVEVKDEGIGIDGSDIPHIFRRFYRADKSRTGQTVRGYGLGLSLADKLVKRINGSISVKSEVGVGSVFTIELNTQN